MSVIDAHPRIAVVGAASLVGEAVIAELRERNFAHAELHLLEESRNLGRAATQDPDEARGARALRDIAEFDFTDVDLVFFCGGSQLAAAHARRAAEHAWVIDQSAQFRRHDDVPLVVADVNPAALAGVREASRGLISLPGSASVALATVLAPLNAPAEVMRVDVASYHAVSGSGRGAMDELAGETVAMLSGKKARGRAFGRQIAFNVIPRVDVIEADGSTREERRLWEETRRVLASPRLCINATAVRVPVFFGHALAVHASFARPIGVAEASAALQAASGIELIAADSANEFPTPAVTAVAPDRVYVGRLRCDPTREGALNLWIVADNVRQCAAHNAVATAGILVNSFQ